MKTNPHQNQIKKGKDRRPKNQVLMIMIVKNLKIKIQKQKRLQNKN
jgi:hypothetical protein